MFSRSKSQKNALTEGKHKITTSSQPLNPKRTFYINPHTALTKTIRVLDLTGIPRKSHTAEPEFLREVKKVVQKIPEHPTWLSITRTPHWYSKTFLIYKTSPIEENPPIAKWKAGLWSSSSNIIEFLELSPHSCHDITITPSSVLKFREQFVKDSVTYEWRPDNALTNNRKFTLYRVIGQERVQIGRYLQGRGLQYGGVLVLNDEEVGDVVGVVSMVNILRKKRQKDRGGGWRRRGFS